MIHKKIIQRDFLAKLIIYIIRYNFFFIVNEDIILKRQIYSNIYTFVDDDEQYKKLYFFEISNLYFILLLVLKYIDLSLR